MEDKGYLFGPVNFWEGVQKTYPTLFASASLKNDKDFLDLRERLRSLPKRIYDIILLLKHGMKENITYAAESLTGVDEALKKLDVEVYF